MEREILKAALAPGPDCLSLDQLGRYADDALVAAERSAAAAHVRTCLNCQAELALLQAFTSSPILPEEAGIVRDGAARLEQRASEIAGAGAGRRTSGHRWLSAAMPRLAGLVAAVLLSVVAARFYFQSPEAPVLPTGVGTADEVTRSQGISIRGPVGDQAEPPRRLEWIAVAGASRYRVRLMEVDRREIWSASTAVAGIDLPPEVRALSVPFKTLLWDVTAYDSSGGATADSGPQAFRLVRR
jgi:hypothetical protein